MKRLNKSSSFGMFTLENGGRKNSNKKSKKKNKNNTSSSGSSTKSSGESYGKQLLDRMAVGVMITPNCLPCPDEDLGTELTEKGVIFEKRNQYTNMCKVKRPKGWGLIAEWVPDPEDSRLMENQYYLVDEQGIVWAICKENDECVGVMERPTVSEEFMIKQYKYDHGWYTLKSTPAESKSLEFVFTRVIRNLYRKKIKKRINSAPVSLSELPPIDLWNTYNELPVASSFS